MQCNRCGYNETFDGEEKFIGIFPSGISLTDTNGQMCGIYACPKCDTVMYTNDSTYINKRKNEYKNSKKY